jgi:PKD repeat protein
MGTVLASDVQTAGTVYSDPAEATFQLASKDPGVSPTPVSYITVNKYRVRYTRTDGGVAPAGFESGATFTVTNAITSSGSFTLVRAQSKTVSPLAELVGQGGTHFVPVTAEVTFEGTDQNGRAVSVTGTIGINFADWADPGDSNPEPVTSFTVAPDTGLQAGQLAQFDASASTVAPGRTINTYAWDFGDGSDVVTGSGPLASHAFAAQGSYAVKLTVTDSAGQAYTVTRTVTVLP